VLSNTNVSHLDWLLPRMPILGGFDHLVFSCDLGLIKPEPAIYQAALERAGVAPEEAAFFDDVATYAEAATRVGIHGRVFRSAEDFPAQLGALGIRL
jgi:putative hydrolase of the HAD superfamily